MIERVLGRVADETARRAHAIHDRVAGIDASRPRDACDLPAAGAIHTSRTDLHAPGAVHTVPASRRAFAGRALARAARLAAFFVVRDDERVVIEHRALKARIGAHVLTDLFTQVARVAVGRESIE